jgi:peptide/nickel transport system substrate-binding protein
MKKMKKRSRSLLMVVLCFVIVFTLAACTTSQTPDTPADSSDTPADSSDTPADSSDTPADSSGGAAKDTLNVAVSLDAGSLDPLAISGSGGYLNAMLTYQEPLFNLKKGAERVWQLATGIDKVGDTQYTVHLREGVTFSNGNPFTAEDVIFTFDIYSKDPVHAINLQSIDLAKTKAVDDYTIDLWYTQPNVAQDLMLAFPMIVDSESYDPQEFAMNPIGTGPYVVTEYVVNSHLYVEARPDYWGGEPPIKKIHFICLNEESQVTNALEIGDVDVARISTKDIDYIKGLGPYSIGSTSMGLTTAAYYNMTEGSPLGSKDARDAISYAIDREAINEVAYNGYAGIVRWPVSEANIDFEERFANLDDTYATGYDIDKAKELAEKAGLVGKTIKMITNGAAEYVTTAEIIQSDLAKIGVTAEIVNYDQATYFATLMDANNFDIGLYSTSAPSLMAADIFASYPSFIPLGWNEAERTDYIQKGMEVLATVDDTERSEKLYEEVMRFYEYVPWYGICDTNINQAYLSNIENFDYWLMGYVPYHELAFK